jgi:hypothetical protein
MREIKPSRVRGRENGSRNPRNVSVTVINVRAKSNVR